MSTRRRRRRSSRAEQVRRKLRDGTYRVDLDRLADRLIDEVAPPPPPPPPAADDDGDGDGES